MVTTGRISGKRSRGRQGIKYLEDLTKWIEHQVKLYTVQDKVEWMAMIVNTGRHGT